MNMNDNNPDSSMSTGQIIALTLDADFRASLRAKDPETLKMMGYAPTAGKPEVRVVTSSEAITFIPMPLLNASHTIKAGDLANIQAAGTTVGSLGSATTASTLGCGCTCFSTMGSLGCAGTAGTSDV